MNIAKRLSERTSAIQSDPSRVAAASKTTEQSRTSPGRMFDAQNLVTQAEEKLNSAERELSDARNRIQELEASSAAAGASEVDISTLVEVPGRRRVLSPAEYAELRDNLANNPLVHPIVYRPLGDGRNEIVSGANRTAIYREEGRTKILGIPFHGDAKAAELGATFSNLLAPSLPDYEKYRQFVRLQEEHGFTRADIIKASGLSESHIQRILSFDKLPHEARAAVASRPDRLGGSAAEEFAALVTAGHGEAVVKAIRALVVDESLTQKQALEMAKPKSPKPEVAPARAINVGKRKLCDVSVRNNVVGFRFSGKGSELSAQEWADKIEAFIKREIEASKSED